MPEAKSGMGSHELPNAGKTDDWLTPPFIIEALGPFALDPCASVDQPWKTAARHYTINDDGFNKRWFGMVWCNPPYGRVTWDWLKRLADHGNGIALTFARTEVKGFVAQIWERADAIMFLTSRLTFHEPITGSPGKGNAGAPSCLVAYGSQAVERLRNSQLGGVFVEGWHV